jgi:hypothetical protein
MPETAEGLAIDPPKLNAPTTAIRPQTINNVTIHHF